MLDSREQKSMAVGREAGAPDDEQAWQLGNLVDMLSDKIEVLEGKVTRGAIANRVRRERQRLPTCLLIENASGPARLPGNFCAEAFPIKASDKPEVELRY